MARHNGKNGKVKVGSGAGTAVLAVRRWNIRTTVATDDLTAMGDEWQSHAVSIPGWTGSMDVVLDPTDDSGQGALTIGASVELKLYSDGDSAGKSYFQGIASIADIGDDTNFQGAVTRNFSFTGNGALARNVVGGGP